jgi:hypothetical protein
VSGLAVAYRRVIMARGSIKIADKLGSSRGRQGFLTRLKQSRAMRAKRHNRGRSWNCWFETCESCRDNPVLVWNPGRHYAIALCENCRPEAADHRIDANIESQIPGWLQAFIAPGPPVDPRDATPQQRLAHALLETAVLDLWDAPKESGGIYPSQRHRTLKLTPRMEAIAWISGAPAPISFDDCCTMLGVDTDALRQFIAGLLNTPGYMPPLTTLHNYENEDSTDERTAYPHPSLPPLQSPVAQQAGETPPLP